MRFTAAQRPESESLHAFFLFLLPLSPAERLPPRGTLLFTSACCSVGAHAPYRCRPAAAPRVRQPDLTASRSFVSVSARIAIPPAQCRFAGLLDERRRACGSTPYRSRFQIAQHLRASSSTGKACASGLSRNIFVATLMIALMPASPDQPRQEKSKGRSLSQFLSKFERSRSAGGFPTAEADADRKNIVLPVETPISAASASEIVPGFAICRSSGRPFDPLVNCSKPANTACLRRRAVDDRIIALQPLSKLEPGESRGSRALSAIHCAWVVSAAAVFILYTARSCASRNSTFFLYFASYLMLFFLSACSFWLPLPGNAAAVSVPSVGPRHTWFYRCRMRLHGCVSCRILFITAAQQDAHDSRVCLAALSLLLLRFDVAVAEDRLHLTQQRCRGVGAHAVSRADGLAVRRINQNIVVARMSRQIDRS